MHEGLQLKHFMLDMLNESSLKILLSVVEKVQESYQSYIPASL